MHAFPKSILYLILFGSLIASISCDNNDDTVSSDLSNIETKSPFTPLELNGSDYIYDSGISIDEAKRRSQISSEAGYLQNPLRQNESATYAGLWIEKEPTYCVVVAFTKNGTATLQNYVEDGPLSDAIRIRTAKYSLEELRVRRQEAEQVLKELDIDFGSALLERYNKIELWITDINEVNSALNAIGYALPDHVVLVERTFSFD